MIALVRENGIGLPRHAMQPWRVSEGVSSQIKMLPNSEG